MNSSTVNLPTPPSLDLGVELVTVVVERCTACGACLATCPTRALRVGTSRPARPVLRPERCTGCLACLEVCPRDALTPRASRPRR